MKLDSRALAALALLALAAPAAADDAGNFVIRLGRDTVSVEHYTRTPSRLVVDQVGRSPRVLRRHFVYDYANGALSHVSVVVTPPGAAPIQTVEANIGADSLFLHIQNGAAPVQNLSVAMPPGTLVLPSSSQWPGYEGRTMKLVQAKSDSVHGALYFLGSPVLNQFTLRKFGRDSIEVSTDRGDLFHARVDRTGRVLGVLPLHGTGKFAVSRVPSLDLDAMVAAFQALEQAGVGLGVLSPRDTVRVATGGASLWIDYGRPAKRGRDVFGAIVPYGEVWRTGANAATQFKTDKALRFGEVVVPAGFYTLWSLPSATGWKLIINGETGQWGTEHKPEKDLYTIDMKVGSLPQMIERFTISVDASPQGGVLNLDWDTTRASVAFTVEP